MRVVPSLILAVLLGVFTPLSTTVLAEKPRDDSREAPAAERNVTVNAILISASREKGETDARLSAYAANLKRTLPFETFKFIGEGSTRIEMSGSSEISLQRDQSVKVEAAYYGEGMVWLRLIWMDQGRQVVNVVYGKWPRGRPIVLAGAVRDGENFAILVTPK